MPLLYKKVNRGSDRLNYSLSDGIFTLENNVQKPVSKAQLDQLKANPDFNALMDDGTIVLLTKEEKKSTTTKK